MGMFYHTLDDASNKVSMVNLDIDGSPFFERKIDGALREASEIGGE